MESQSLQYSLVQSTYYIDFKKPCNSKSMISCSMLLIFSLSLHIAKVFPSRLCRMSIHFGEAKYAVYAHSPGLDSNLRSVLLPCFVKNSRQYNLSEDGYLLIYLLIKENENFLAKAVKTLFANKLSILFYLLVLLRLYVIKQPH